MIELPGWNDLISVNGFCYSSSMGESPKLNIPLKTSVAPTKGITSPTFARNSTATYIDANGVLQTAAIDVPRFQNGRYLVEPAATNIAPYPETLSYWEVINLTRTSGYSDPFSRNTGTKLETVSSAANHQFCRYLFSAIPTGTSTGSVFVKKGNHRYVGIRMFNTMSGNRLVFDFDTETLTANGLTAGTYGVIKLANGWYRLWHNQPTTFGGLYYASVCLTNTAGDEYLAIPAGSYIYATGMQVESGTAPSSYIPTTTAPLRRVSDVLHYDVSSVITQGQGSLYCEFKYRYTSGFPRILELTDNTTANNISIRITDSRLLGAVVTSSSTNQAVIYTLSVISDDTLYKVCVTYKNDEVKFYANGVLIWSDFLATIPINLSKLSVGCALMGYGQLNGEVGNIKYFKEVLTEAEAIKITTL